VYVNNTSFSWQRCLGGSGVSLKVLAAPPVAVAEPNRLFNILRGWSLLAVALVIPATGLCRLQGDDVSKRSGYRFSAMAIRVDTTMQDQKGDRQSFKDRLFKLALARNP
jgi:hypothetical protein